MGLYVLIFSVLRCAFREAVNIKKCNFFKFPRSYLLNQENSIHLSCQNFRAVRIPPGCPAFFVPTV